MLNCTHPHSRSRMHEAAWPSLTSTVADLYGGGQLRYGADEDDEAELERQELALERMIHKVVDRVAPVPMGVQFHRQGGQTQQHATAATALAAFSGSLVEPSIEEEEEEEDEMEEDVEEEDAIEEEEEEEEEHVRTLEYDDDQDSTDEDLFPGDDQDESVDDMSMEMDSEL